jgi:GNAT superfamily N-acetyltransferase
MLAPFDPQTVRISVREDRPHSIRFLAQRGFNEMMREWESRLDVAAFDASPYVEAFDAPARHGVTIRTLAELQAIDPDWGPKCHALETELFRDVPSTNAPTEVPFEVWWDEVRSHPGMLPDAYFVAVHDGQYVGLSTLHRDCTGGYLDTGLTGVIRSYRRKGIALAMKLRAIEYAQAVGAPEIRTWNETGNTGMLSINVRLGFLRQPAWIEFAKTLAPS